MKVFNTIAKIVVALAAIAGVVYIAATYGDRIVAWAKSLLGKCQCCCGEDCVCQCDQVSEDLDEQADLDATVLAGDQDFEG